MIEFLSSWAKSLGVAIVLVSIFEMVLPNNKTKKYIRVVLGVFVLYNIISPFINNKDKLSLASIDVDNYTSTYKSEVNQASMDDRIESLYEQELEKDIKNKIQEQGFKVLNCKVKAIIGDTSENKENTIKDSEIDRDNHKENTIKEIRLKVEKKEVQEKERTTENRIVTEIQKIKEIDTRVQVNKEKTNIDREEQNSNQEPKQNQTKKITRIDIQNIKRFLIDEYGVDEKCLEIN